VPTVTPNPNQTFRGSDPARPAKAAPDQAETAIVATVKRKPRRRGLFARAEEFVSRLSTRNNFWHRLCSMIWLPYAFKSGISMRKLDSSTFTAVLPFRRINRNWYNAMAGAALLANSEIAGGMFVFEKCGGDYTVVCKEMRYRFLRPCLGPAVYRVECSEDIRGQAEARQEFNVDLEMGIYQQVKHRGRELRVGKCWVTFHCTPKSHHAEKAERKKLARKNSS
jgi:acyl-coenzyme A thioesterase PaaI-like protein